MTTAPKGAATTSTSLPPTAQQRKSHQARREGGSKGSPLPPHNKAATFCCYINPPSEGGREKALSIAYLRWEKCGCIIREGGGLSEPRLSVGGGGWGARNDAVVYLPMLPTATFRR